MSDRAVILSLIVGVIVCGCGIGGCALGRPAYLRYQNRLDAENDVIIAKSEGEAARITAQAAGEAALQRAENEKKVMIETARAEQESAELRAAAIRIMGEMAAQYPEYREQEFIGAFAEAVQSGAIDQIIYVPTESNVPIVESRGRQ